MKFCRRTLLSAGTVALGAFGLHKVPSKSSRADDPALIQANAAAIRIRRQEEIVAEARRIAPVLSDIIRSAGQDLKAGDVPRTIDRRLVGTLSAHGLAAAMLGYRGYPAASAISVEPHFLNGTPEDSAIGDGSLVTIELGCSTSRAYATQGWTFPVGRVSQRKAALIKACRAALEAGVNAIHEGVTTRQIGWAIQEAAKSSGHYPVRDFCGYAMGQERIQKPNILNYVSDQAQGCELPVGTILNIYVALKTGPAGLRILPNGWTATTDHGEIAAVATAMVVVERHGKSVLTAFPGGGET